jgi:AraC-like DNA-binding protein
MKVVAFNVPKISKEAFRLQEDKGSHFYDQLHQHPEIQIMLILQGEGTLIAGDYVGRFEPNDLYVIGSGQPHVFRSDKNYYSLKSKLKVRAISIYFNEKYWGDSFWQLEEMKLVRKFSLKSLRGLQVMGKSKTEIARDVLQLNNTQGLAKLIVSLSMLKKFAEAKDTRPLSVSGTVNGFNPEEGKRMNAILAFTFRESHRKIYIREAAGVANLSIEAFCRYFKLHTQKTFTTFLNELRVSNACQMLLNKEWSIQDVCYQAGFNNISNFNRIFKKVTGKSPSGYAKMNRP